MVSYLKDNKDFPVLLSQYQCCWRPGNRSDQHTSHNIYIVCSRIIWVPGWKILFNNGIGLTFSWQINSYGFHNAFIFIVYYSDITHTSWHLNSSHNRMFVQEHVHANNKQGKSEGFESCDRPIVRKRPIWVKIGDVLSRVTLKFDGWPWKTIGHLSFAVSSFVQHFIAIGELKLELLSGNAQFGSNSTIVRAVWPWNLTCGLEKQ